MVCIKCGTVISENAKFCGRCGTKAEREQLKRCCTSCGAELAENQLICTNCGMRVKGQVKKDRSSDFKKRSVHDARNEAAIQRYKNIPYTFNMAGLSAGKSGKCTVILYEDRIDLMKEYCFDYVIGCFGIVFGIFLALLLAGAGLLLMNFLTIFAGILFCVSGYFLGWRIGFFGNKILDALLPLKSMEISIDYSTVKNCHREKHFRQRQVIITLKNGDSYCISVGGKQDEIYEMIQKKAKTDVKESV